MRRIGLLLVACACVAAQAAEPHRGVAGSSFAANSPYATDAYPGFDGLDDVKRPEKKEKGWFNWVDRATSAEQFALAEEFEAAGAYRKARRAFDALVCEWPASPEAWRAQFRIVKIYEHEKDYDNALEELEYLLDFYPSECPYLEMVEYLYQLTNLMVKEKKTMFGFSFTSDRIVRQHYESVVRRAPRASYVPEAMLKIADLREQNNEYEEAVQVYNQLIMKCQGADVALPPPLLQHPPLPGLAEVPQDDDRRPPAPRPRRGDAGVARGVGEAPGGGRLPPRQVLRLEAAHTARGGRRLGALPQGIPVLTPCGRGPRAHRNPSERH